MKEKIISPWIKIGYEIFALKGPANLKIECLSKEVGKNKSSFYHHFADLETFTTILLTYHLKQAKLFAIEESGCETRDELINVFINYKIDLLFNRQLRIYRDNILFEECFVATNQISEKAIIRIWAKILNLENNSYLAKLVFRLSLENFFLQITNETINYSWINNYMDNLLNLIATFKKEMKH